MKVGADRRRRMDAEQQDEDRHHQRSATDPCQTDDEADDEAGCGVERVD
jgi:hypothetical protein